MHSIFLRPASRRFEWCLLLAFLGCYPLSLLIPPAWGWENGVVENAQVLVLLGGCLLAWVAARRLDAGPARVLARCVMPLWLLLSGRELSWGAVFLPPIGFDITGPIYASRILWYRPLVAPVAAVILALVLYTGWRHRLDRLLKGTIVRRRFPWGGTRHPGGGRAGIDVRRRAFASLHRFFVQARRGLRGTRRTRGLPGVAAGAATGVRGGGGARRASRDRTQGRAGCPATGLMFPPGAPCR
jgi:hypothetical protein